MSQHDAISRHITYSFCDKNIQPEFNNEETNRKHRMWYILQDSFPGRFKRSQHKNILKNKGHKVNCSRLKETAIHESWLNSGLEGCVRGRQGQL